jgi:hypothetical protein
MAAAFTKVLELAETLDDPEHKLRALRGLQYQGHWTNHFRAALSFAQGFHDLAMSQSNPNDRRLGERLLGSVKSDLGDLAGARRHLEAVLTGASDPGQTAVRFDDDIRFQNDGQVAARVFLSAVLWRQGFSDQALRMAEMGLAEAQAIGHAGTECLALALGSCPLALCTGNLAAAAEFTKLLVGLSTKHGLPQWAPHGARFRRAIALKGGDVSGIEGADQSDAHLRSLTAATVLVDALATAERGAEGLAMLDEFAAQVPELGGFASEFSRLRGELLLLQTAPGAAKPSEDLFRSALEVAQAQGALGLALRAATSLARLLRDQGRPVEAIACLQPIHDRFTEGFDTVDFTSAKCLLDDLAVARGT